MHRPMGPPGRETEGVDSIEGPCLNDRGPRIRKVLGDLVKSYLAR